MFADVTFSNVIAFGDVDSVAGCEHAAHSNGTAINHFFIYPLPFKTLYRVTVFYQLHPDRQRNRAGPELLLNICVQEPSQRMGLYHFASNWGHRLGMARPDTLPHKGVEFEGPRCHPPQNNKLQRGERVVWKPIIVAAAVLVAGCSFNDPNDVAGRLSREFDEGEKLMKACEKNENRCPAYFDFKTEWEAEVANYTTFEVALAKHKARAAKGLAL